ncbi:delta adaptin [Reticulomyxa filosa]|uniref:Delta adaptin n=1 Tax=Reticulomyxa filosa TaxID=46433 RepID=X6MZS4_RETFI|nr:delta adaptin [Reticulomyxa filosa]|eukprot:ETO18974.1 delta adaptin [Reticulomyxa filosa]
MMTAMFRKTLLDLVKGLRSNKEDESTFINQCLTEIKEEVKDKDHDIKANAIQKLCYVMLSSIDHFFSPISPSNKIKKIIKKITITTIKKMTSFFLNRKKAQISKKMNKPKKKRKEKFKLLIFFFDIKTGVFGSISFIHRAN